MTNFLAGIILTIAVAMGYSMYHINSGEIDIAADSAYHPMVQRLLEQIREHSLNKQLSTVRLPENLNGNDRIKRAAGLYEDVCAGCHLTPREPTIELSKAYFPAPIDLFKNGKLTPTPTDLARQFWIIKHGVKATAMPAGSKIGMNDEAVWDMVAFLQKLPTLNVNDYTRLVAASKGKPIDGLEEYQGALPSGPQPLAPETQPPQAAAPVLQPLPAPPKK